MWRFWLKNSDLFTVVAQGQWRHLYVVRRLRDMSEKGAGFRVCLDFQLDDSSHAGERERQGELFVHQGGSEEPKSPAFSISS